MQGESVSILLTIRVTPRSRRSCIELDAHGVLRARLASPPEDGRANHELIELLAKGLNMPRRDISIESGLTSRIKRIRVHGTLTLEDAYKRLGLEVQRAVF